MWSSEVIVRSAHGVVLKRREGGVGETPSISYVLYSPDCDMQQFENYADADAAWLFECGGRRERGADGRTGMPH